MTCRITKTARTLCLLIAVILAAALFVGCGQNVSSSSSDASASQSVASIKDDWNYDDPPHYDIGPGIDLAGREMFFAVSHKGLILPEEGKSVEADLTLSVVSEIQEKIKCTVAVKEVTDWNEVLTALIAGEEYANVIVPPVKEAGNFICAGVCCDFLRDEIAAVTDLSQNKWHGSITSAAQTDGSVYVAATPIGWPTEKAAVVFFNKAVATQSGIAENTFYTLWEKKEWTWDAFAKYAKMALKDRDKSGAVDSVDDRWGFVAPGKEALLSFCSTAKVDAVSSLDSGKAVYALNTAHAISSLKKLNALFTSDGIYCPETRDDSGQLCETVFVEGGALFFVTTFKNISSNALREMRDDWGVLPIPLGPKEGGGWQKDYVSRVDDDINLCIIPTTVKDIESTAIVLEALVDGFYRIELNAVDVLAILYCRDDKSIEVANSVFSAAALETSRIICSTKSNKAEWESSVGTFLQKVLADSGFDVKKGADSCAKTAQKIIDDFVSKTKS